MVNQNLVTGLLREMSVNALVHGHNDTGGHANDDPRMPIISADRSAYKEINGTTGNRQPVSHIRISTQGKLCYY